MAKRKIVWSHKAQIKLFQILDFYTERNKSKSYSTKLYKRLIKELPLLVDHPEIGKLTDDDTIRGLIVDVFILFYETKTDPIIIHTI
ncbi:type II toxin-antitoxin system RelE/ParE family toxin [Roseimarinus sediminis]|jgi:toxin YoeB|uniref:type II toxin-antitoxin system RelE/ParE family toxin n=1 Tax=Roseimarinus sediminis TaxID=1610899 RepID=UPI003D1AD8E1